MEYNRVILKDTNMYNNKNESHRQYGVKEIIPKEYISKDHDKKKRS